MKRNAPHAAGSITATEGDGTLDESFDLLADPDCRAILRAADTAMTTNELAETCDIALSTAYRKVERLSDTPLLVEGVRFDPDGDHAAEYVRGPSDATIEFTGDGVALTLEIPDTSEPAAGFEATGVSAD
jgi:hypothetical protein